VYRLRASAGSLVALAARIGLLAVMAGSCSSTNIHTGESRTFRRYWQAYAEYSADLDKFPQLARDRENWRKVIAAMSDEKISWLIRTRYAPPFAHDAEWANQKSFVTRGSDWTRYSMLPNGTCTTGEDCARQTRAIAVRKCADYRFRIMTGYVKRDGRQTGERPSQVVGIVPFGTHEYRGTLTRPDGKEFSVTWSLSWIGANRDARAKDPLDDQPHDFKLQRLPGAENWEITRWSGMPDPPSGPALTPANCLTQLGVWPLRI
jgi:hypothetical protein